MSGWDGEFCFNGHHAGYRGTLGAHREHAHLAVQLVISLEDVLVYSRARATRFPGRAALLIGSRVPHRLTCEGPVELVFIDPAGTLGRRLRDLASDSVVPIRHALIAEIVSKKQVDRDQMATGAIGSALAELQADPTQRLSELAERLDVQPSTLRRQARSRLGCSLASWRLWIKLERACHALANGVAPAEAAIAGGFSDQAHFARTMRRMFGVSPSQATGPLEAAQHRSPRYSEIEPVGV